ncbi:hypothetical protein D9611_014415 [Ephemerocybe angulata]|uniref:Uncharacterized protein n=1 Tax=Ephemerocybe angulata TaxID=980116 RepID=A0A8H5EZ41_9AGAR|nr:hypothetical protein D9611_014415 [Tulosesus angulatus]
MSPLSNVLVWDVKKGEMVWLSPIYPGLLLTVHSAPWHETGHRSEVTCILRSPQPNFFAVGYADGSIRLWDSTNETVVTVFNGHKKSVTALAFDDRAPGLLQARKIPTSSSGISLPRLVYTVCEAIATRLLGSTFLLQDRRPGLLLTSSKDTFLKLWDLTTHHCIQTVVAHRSEIWSLDVNPEQDLIFTGSGEGEVKAWRIDRDAVKDGLKETESGEIAKMIHPITNLPLGSNHRVSQISFHPKQPYVAFQSHDKSIEIFRIRDDEEVKKKLARRRKRAKEKKQEKGDKKGPEITAMEIDQDDEEVPFIDKFTPHVVVRASGKVRSFNFANETTSQKNIAELMVALSNNALEVYNIPQPTKSTEAPPEATRNHSVSLPGHRADVRSLCLSSDDRILASAANGH